MVIRREKDEREVAAQPKPGTRTRTRTRGSAKLAYRGRASEGGWAGVIAAGHCADAVAVVEGRRPREYLELCVR